MNRQRLLASTGEFNLGIPPKIRLINKPTRIFIRKILLLDIYHLYTVYKIVAAVKIITKRALRLFYQSS